MRRKSTLGLRKDSEDKLITMDRQYGLFHCEDILLCVADRIQSPFDLYRLHLVCQTFHRALFSPLYKLLAVALQSCGSRLASPRTPPARTQSGCQRTSYGRDSHISAQGADSLLLQRI